jgi:hypothetical protein
MSGDVEKIKIKKVCACCTKDRYLKNEIGTKGKKGKCSYCGGRRTVMKIDDFADYIEHAFEDHYQQTSDDYDFGERPGETVSWMMQEAAQIDEPLAEDIRAVLEDRSGVGHDKDTMHDENPFSEEAHYQEKGVELSEYQARWGLFRKSILTEARLFNSDAEAILNEIFAGLDNHATAQGKKVIIHGGPGTRMSVLYRARMFQSNEKLEAAIARPDVELGAPPSAHATTGRMNSKGIGVFYGATHPGVALAEIRPPVGSRVLVGRFQIIRPLRLLDLDAMQSIQAKGSIFERSYVHDLEKNAFLHTLSETLTRPVLPDDEASEYLVTQAIADYLATRRELALDGIVYPSVQQSGKLKRNVVLFHKSARVEDLGLPKHTRINAYTSEQDEDGIRPDYHVTVTLPPKKEKETQMRPEWLPDPWADYPDPNRDTRKAALRIELPSLTVKHVESISIVSEKFSVRRHEYEMSKAEQEELKKKNNDELEF